MSKQKPIISVIMPVYNEEKYLASAIDSILNQTFTDFELIILDDGSTDKTRHIIETYTKKDSRVIPVYNDENRGLVYNLNYGLRIAQGKYIARMDGDDIALPNRFKEQVDYLVRHEEIIICGTWVRTIGDAELENHIKGDSSELKIRLLYRPIIAHPTYMMKRTLVDEFQLCYDPDYFGAEDYKFLTEAVKFGQIGVVKKEHLCYRIHDNQVSARYKNQQKQLTVKIRKEFSEQMGMGLDEKELWAINMIAEESRVESFSKLLEVYNYNRKITDGTYAENKDYFNKVGISEFTNYLLHLQNLPYLITFYVKVGNEYERKVILKMIVEKINKKIMRYARTVKEKRYFTKRPRVLLD